MQTENFFQLHILETLHTYLNLKTQSGFGRSLLDTLTTHLMQLYFLSLSYY